MTREEVMEMAYESGMIAGYEGEPDLLTRFAALVAAAERKECADLCKYVYTEVLDDRDGIAKLCEGYILGRGNT
jgi:hypothetical protein